MLTLEKVLSMPNHKPETREILQKRADDLKPSLRYMALLIEGAVEHGLPDDWITMLREIPAEEESEAAKAARALLDRVIRKKPVAE